MEIADWRRVRDDSLSIAAHRKAGKALNTRILEHPFMPPVSCRHQLLLVLRAGEDCPEDSSRDEIL